VDLLLNSIPQKLNQVLKYIKYYFVLLLVVFLQACNGNSNDPGRNRPNANQQDDATSVETITASSSDISQQIKSFGNIRAQEIVNVTPQVSNRVTKIYAQLGDTVKQGEVLAKIYDATYQDQYEQAKSQLQQSKNSYVRDSLQFERQQKLYKKGLISSTEYENAKATFQNSKSALQSSKANLTSSLEDLKNTKITSPVYGVVLSRNISGGDLASTGQVAYQIANLTGYQCRVYLPLDEWKEVKLGQEVDFRVSNQPGIRGEGRVTHISPRLDPTTGLGEVIISLTGRGQSIYQGVLVQATINVETHKNSVVVPRSALVENVQTLIEPESNSIQLQRNYSAFKVQGDSLALKKKLKLGIEQGDKVEILSGIDPGDQIVITGQNNLEDSSKVQVAQQSDFQQQEVPIKNMSQDKSSNGKQDTSSTS